MLTNLILQTYRDYELEVEHQRVLVLSSQRRSLQVSMAVKVSSVQFKSFLEEP